MRWAWRWLEPSDTPAFLSTIIPWTRDGSPTRRGSRIRRSASATPVSSAVSGVNRAHGARSKSWSLSRSSLGAVGGWSVPATVRLPRSWTRVARSRPAGRLTGQVRSVTRGASAPRTARGRSRARIDDGRRGVEREPTERHPAGSEVESVERRCQCRHAGQRPAVAPGQHDVLDARRGVQAEALARVQGHAHRRAAAAPVDPHRGVRGR